MINDQEVALFVIVNATQFAAPRSREFKALGEMKCLGVTRVCAWQRQCRQLSWSKVSNSAEYPQRRQKHTGQ